MTEKGRALYNGEDTVGLNKGQFYDFRRDLDTNVCLVKIKGELSLLAPQAFEEHFKIVTDKFMVFVKNGQAPKKIHDSQEDAQEEAFRLLENKQGEEVTILKIIKKFKSVTTIEEEEI